MNFFQRINAMTPAEALVAYIERGKSVFPVRPRTLDDRRKAKAPQVPWKVYQTGLATKVEVDQWLERGVEALGFPTGEYNGYNVLDADSPEAEEWLAANAPPTPIMSRTRKGLHRFYRCGAFKVPTLTGIGPVPGIDSRGEGGFVVCPPSIIAGHKYQWETDAHQPVSVHQVPSLDSLGESFFCQTGTSPGQGRRKRPRGHENGPDAEFFEERRYNDDGLVAIGCRDVYMRDLTMGIIASEKSETGKMPSGKYVAETAWRRFQQHADMSDGEWTYDTCLEKAEYALGRIADGTIVIRDDDGFPTLPADLPEVDLGELPVDTRWKIIIRRGYDPGDPDLWASKAACMFAVACVLVRAKAKNDLIASVLLDPDLKISDHVLAQPNPRRYAARQIQRAKEICNG